MSKYKLLLVDDEAEVRQGVLEKIEWEKYGFEVVGEAENGKEALEIADKTNPDVIITDIKMPFMDGLELAKIVRERFPTIKIIVLTGFDEFEYAQKAIKVNVTEYILKPISSSELISIIIKIKEQIDKEIAEKENIEELREYYNRSIPILKEKFLVSLITSTMRKEEIQEKAKSYNLNLAGKSFLVSILSIDKTSEKWNEKELVKFAVLNVVEESINKYEAGITFLHNEQIVIVTVYTDEDRETVTNKAFKFLEELRQTIEKFLKITVTIGVGNICNEIIYIHQSYENANSVLDYRLIMGNDRIIWIEDIEPESTKKVIFDELKEHGLVSAIKVGTKEELALNIDNLFEGITDSKTSLKEYQIYLMEMLTAILKAARNSGVDIDSVFGEGSNLFFDFYNLTSIDEVKQWLKSISIRIMEHIAKDRIDTSKLLVENAKNFVKEMYYDSEITINKICDFLHISPTYFSFIFKKETKITFINYLTQVRMDAAKELLRNTNLKSFEIAEKVGYSEPNYFSYSFKKRFGLSPSEYRNSFNQ